MQEDFFVQTHIPMSISPTPKKVAPVVYFIGITAALAGLLFGLDVGVISGAQIYIQRDLGVSDQMIEWIVSALLWGAVVGALGSGILCNKLGRRRTLLASGLLFAAGAVFCAVAPDAHTLIVARLVVLDDERLCLFVYWVRRWLLRRRRRRVDEPPRGGRRKPLMFDAKSPIISLDAVIPAT